jgi:hypothetical protein
MNTKFQSGQASRTVIILAVIILIVAGIVYGVTRFALSKKTSSTVNNGPPPLVYDLSIGDIRFILESSVNMGSVLYGKASRFPNYQPNLVTTEKFIKVTVRAQDKGNNDTTQYAWDLGNIVDSAGRNFLPITDKAYSWIPFPDLCGAVLHPEFEPTPCVRYYEVSKVSEGLKLEVISVKPNSTKQQKDLLDLKITK